MSDTTRTAPEGADTALAPEPTTKGETLRQTIALGGAPEVEPSAKDASIRPFEFRASDEDLADLRRRILAARWPDKETVDDDSQGVQLATMRKLADYWATEYDWRKCEA